MKEISQDDVDRLNALIGNGMAKYLAFDVIKGKISEENAWKEQACSNLASEIRQRDRNEWPQIDVIWDLSPANFHLAFDSEDPAEFKISFPDIHIIGIGIEDLHLNLNHASRRSKGPFFSLYIHKTARLVAHLKLGGLVTPPMVRHFSTGLHVVGGNHRFGWARYRKQGRIPILFPASEKEQIEAVLPNISEWP